MKFDNMSKNKKLALSLLFDAIGFVPFIDLVWAPTSAYIMTKMYKGNKGKIAGIITFIEEFLPGLDFIPTFTLMWLITYVFNTNNSAVVEVN
ncbi:hypothetical protein RXV94_14020 [Yeosuana sp. MJ-SS3]|uniref:Uncharacterized protein n=1 Tax=Gilvirhabdus luticola TaxID=3079858 RepID=A0ABU3UA49_9FLAO|nr:hypothetical protein [Yeosuana sp. MJ-SS3]MDU8887284.1 hypothetical protein [Yeosuana sp. MJ-SS3]